MKVRNSAVRSAISLYAPESQRADRIVFQHFEAADLFFRLREHRRGDVFSQNGFVFAPSSRQQRAEPLRGDLPDAFAGAAFGAVAKQYGWSEDRYGRNAGGAHRFFRFAFKAEIKIAAGGIGTNGRHQQEMAGAALGAPTGRVCRDIEVHLPVRFLVAPYFFLRGAHGAENDIAAFQPEAQRLGVPEIRQAHFHARIAAGTGPAQQQPDPVVGTIGLQQAMQVAADKTGGADQGCRSCHDFCCILARMEPMQFRENYPLRDCNTFGIEAMARYYSAFDSSEELEALLEQPLLRDIPTLLVLGGGSNILLTADVDGLVLKNTIGGIETIREDDEFVYVRAGAGVNWHQFVLHCLAQGYAGVENLSLIPGSVGASPMQNIGAYGVEIKDVFHELEAVHVAERSRRTFNAAECAFGYRESVFKNKFKGQYIITSVTYRLRKQPVFHTEYGAIRQELEAMGVTELSIGAISQAVINIRSSKLPDWREIGNAGSFFKNPQVSLDKYAELKTAYPSLPAYPQESGMKLAAGWLIEQCGWKGYREGDAGCYPKQALVLVNYGKATGGEIYALSEKIIGSVQDKFGVLLEREVNIV